MPTFFSWLLARLPRILDPNFLVLSCLLILTVFIAIRLNKTTLRHAASCEPDEPSMRSNVSGVLRDQSRLQTSRTVSVNASEIPAVVNQEAIRQGIKQPYDAFLVLDVEGTCVEGTARFDYPNEIIEWPVCLLLWKDKDHNGLAKELEVVDEYRSFVKPTWRPQLSAFCTNLTGITQAQVNGAPTFTTLLESFTAFLEKHGLIEPMTGRRLIRYCWCTDGPFDIRDFVVKQCFISRVAMPTWITGDVLDVRSIVRHLDVAGQGKALTSGRKPVSQFPSRRVTLNIPRQLYALGLTPFEGRQHSGIDDTRNIARIVIELARRGVQLVPNTAINPNRRWPWMGKHGKILDGYH